MKVGDRVKDCLFTANGDGRGVGTITEIIPLDHPAPDREEQHFNYCCMVRWDKPLEDFCRWYEDPHISEDYLDDIKLLESEEWRDPWWFKEPTPPPVQQNKLHGCELCGNLTCRGTCFK